MYQRLITNSRLTYEKIILHFVYLLSRKNTNYIVSRYHGSKID
jgi:hypothetical protein